MEFLLIFFLMVTYRAVKTTPDGSPERNGPVDRPWKSIDFEMETIESINENRAMRTKQTELGGPRRHLPFRLFFGSFFLPVPPRS